MMEAVEFAARDGYRIAGTLQRPERPNGRAVLVNAAVGVRENFYRRFAGYLASRGFSVLTYDYRGIGASRRGPLRELRTGMADWARLDAAGALDFLERAAPGARLAGVGHSFGGQSLGITPGNERVRALYTVGSQAGYWGHWRGAGRAGMWLFTHVMVPALAGALGYLPASRLGQGEDLPGVAAREWASWCRHPGYLVGALAAHEDYARIAIPLRACCIEDDGYAPLAAVEAFLAQHPNAARELKRIAPRDVGAERIGHFGFFREQFRDTLWRDAADWLTARSE
jgi:predicted alpha/beta hydrolase